MIITLSDVQLSDEQSKRVRPALDHVFGRDATSATWEAGGYHYWRVIHILEAPTMLAGAEVLIHMAAEARDAAGLDALAWSSSPFSVGRQDLNLRPEDHDSAPSCSAG